MRFLFPGYCDSVRTLRQAPVSCDLDLVSIIFPSLSWGTTCDLFHSESVASYWGLLFENTSETTRRAITVCKTCC